MENKSENLEQNPPFCKTDVSGSYKILDKDGVEMPDHWSGRRRTYEEAEKMVDSLNKNGEYRPYTMVKV